MIRPEHRELARRLAAVPAFADCPAEDLVALAQAGRCISLPARWTLISAQTPADACYVLLEGEAHVFRRAEQLGVLLPGAVVGEMGLVQRGLRTADVVSVGPVRVLRVDYPALAALLTARPRLRAALGAVYDEHLAAPRPAAGADLAGA